MILPMATLDKPNAFAKQIVLYIKNQDYQNAYSLASEFTHRFPNEMIAHFLLAKSAYWLGKYSETAVEARKAFNLSSHPDDLLACAVLASTGYYETGEYVKGRDILVAMKKIKTSEELETMLFIFSLALRDATGAARHLEDLYKLNNKTADALMAKFLR